MIAATRKRISWRRR
uniref:Uncharacterized protein n=1 Tax=Arundo donax TaxID=35708 RepID=A0A0A8Y952_ARUDO